MAGIVAVPLVLDLDHVGAQVAQDLGRERPREHPGEVQDADTGERKGIHGAELICHTRPPPRAPTWPAHSVCFRTTGAQPRQSGRIRL